MMVLVVVEMMVELNGVTSVNNSETLRRISGLLLAAGTNRWLISVHDMFIKIDLKHVHWQYHRCNFND